MVQKKKKKLEIVSNSSNLVKIRKFVSDIAVTAGFIEEDVSKIELAVDEACSNVVRHAYKGRDNFKIDIEVVYDTKKLSVTVTDKGKGFDPKEFEVPEMKDYLQKFHVGGLGIHLMKELMDQVEFEIKPNQKNQVVLTKYLK